MRLIDADKLPTGTILPEEVEQTPAEDAVLVRHGRWVPIELDTTNPFNTLLGGGWECSECGNEVYLVADTIDHNYCSNCGAKMDSREGSTNIVAPLSPTGCPCPTRQRR